MSDRELLQQALEALELQKALVIEAQEMAIKLSGLNAELLSALRDLLAYVEQGYGDTESGEGALARAAIARAEGTE